MAYKKYTRKTYRKKGSYKRKSYARKSTRRQSPMKKLVKREIARAAETKSRSWSQLGGVIQSVANAGFDINNVFPIGMQAGAFELVQGTGQGQRIGNRIEISKCTLKGTMVALPYNVTTNPNPCPVQIKMFIFYQRDAPTSIPEPRTVADFFDLNNSATTFNNDLVDMWAPVNEEKYRVLYSKVFKLGFADAVAQTAGTSGQLNFVNNDFSYNCNFSVDLTKYMVKNQVYQDNSVNAMTRQLYCMFVPAYANGSSIASAVVPAGVQYQAILKYKDA